MPTLTYHEIAAQRGIGLASARKFAQKKRWPRTIGNDGQARIHVPDDFELIPTPDPEDDRNDVPAVDPALVATLEERISGLKDLVEAERKRASVEAKRAEAEAKRADAGAARITDLETDRDGWRARSLETEQKLEELQSMSWWRRLVG